MKRLEGKGAFVTGGGSGIGRAQARRFAREGAAVIVADINEAAAASVAAEIRDQGDVAFPVRLDIADTNDIGRAVTAALKSVQHIHILSNTAGVYDGGAHTLDTSTELWEKVFAVNITGMFQMTKALLPHMIANREGVILNISSGAAFIGGAGGTSYTVSKHAVVGFTKQLAAEYGHRGIRAIGIAPGLIETPMVANLTADPNFVAAVRKRPAGRVGTPDDIANAALYLVSSEADYIHGVTVQVDGGKLSVF
jgi:3-oxoacyl-[acyl-carrier protein] reductase